MWSHDNLATTEESVSTVQVSSTVAYKYQVLQLYNEPIALKNIIFFFFFTHSSDACAYSRSCVMFRLRVRIGFWFYEVV